MFIWFWFLTLFIHDIFDNIVDDFDVCNELSEFNDFFSDPLYVVNMVDGDVLIGDSISFVKCKGLTIRGGDIMYSSDNHAFGLQNKNSASDDKTSLQIWECLGRTSKTKRCRVKFHPMRIIKGRMYNHLKNYPHSHDSLNVLQDKKKRMCSSLVKVQATNSFYRVNPSELALKVMNQVYVKNSVSNLHPGGVPAVRSLVHVVKE